jgi:hypothetical protein
MLTRMPRLAAAISALVVGVFLAPHAGCAEAGCTEIGCDSTAQVGFSGFSIPGPYDLTIDALQGPTVVRCNDPGSMAALENPDWVTCDAAGFTLHGAEANRTAILVDLYDVAADTSLAANLLVQLPVGPDGELQPNGPDCPPVCYERFGSILDDGRARSGPRMPPR